MFAPVSTGLRYRRMLVGLTALLASISTLAQTASPTSAPNALYVEQNGAIRVVGNDGMEDMLNDLNARFAQSYPGIRFDMILRGSSTAMPALTAGTSAFAPMARDAWPTDMSAFDHTYGHPVSDIKIAYSGWGPRPSYKTPPAVYVNKANPLAGITLAQLREVFVSGDAHGELADWSQLNASAKPVRRIHIYGLPDDGGFATAFRIAHFNGHPFNSRYETLPNVGEVIKAVADDPYGIAFVGWVNAEKISANVRLLPLAKKDGDAFALPTQTNLAADRYPLTAYVHIYVNKVPGQPLAPWLIDYLRLALSDTGQTAIANSRNTAEGYFPLSESLRQEELKKVDALATP